MPLCVKNDVWISAFMILKRKIYRELLKWKNECNGTRAMLINGARRVGKSFISWVDSYHK